MLVAVRVAKLVPRGARAAAVKAAKVEAEAKDGRPHHRIAKLEDAPRSLLPEAMVVNLCVASSVHLGYVIKATTAHTGTRNSLRVIALLPQANARVRPKMGRRGMDKEEATHGHAILLALTRSVSFIFGKADAH